MQKTYLSTHDLTDRYRCSSRTIFRWMRRAINPFPQPCFRNAGSSNLWESRDILLWEQREKERCRAYSHTQAEADIGTCSAFSS